MMMTTMVIIVMVMMKRRKKWRRNVIARIGDLFHGNNLFSQSMNRREKMDLRWL